MQVNCVCVSECVCEYMCVCVAQKLLQVVVQSKMVAVS